MKRFAIIAAFLVASMAPVCAFAGGGVYLEVLETQRAIEQRATSLMQMYDPKAMAIVTIELKKTEVDLPASPFVYEDFTVDPSRLEIERINVRVFSSLRKESADARKMLESSFANLATKVSVEWVPVKTPEDIPQTVRLQFPAMDKVATTMLQSPYAIGFAGAFLAMMLFGVGAMFALGRNISNTAGKVSGILADGVTSMKDGSAGVGGRDSSREMVAKGNATGAAAGDNSIFSAFSAQSCLALWTDCYWCEADDYAAFAWSQFSQVQRLDLVKDFPATERYVRHLEKQTPLDYGLHGETAYLNPLPFFPLDNNSLTGLVLKHPALLTKLSRLRSEALNLGLGERIGLQRMALQRTDLPDFSTVRASAERVMESFGRISLSTENTETEAMNLRDLPITTKEQFLTLAWLMQLPKEKVTGILDKFTARELASAWIGPRALLEFLNQCLPEKKRELVMSYRATIKPSRNSRAFLLLHSAAMAAFKDANAPKPMDELAKPLAA